MCVCICGYQLRILPTQQQYFSLAHPDNKALVHAHKSHSINKHT